MVRGLLVFICMLLGISVSGEEIRFEHYGSQKGLSHNSVRAILQDNKGFLWLGTFGGINRFDGYNFKAFTSKLNKPKYLQDDDITQMVMDKHDNIWIGTSNGLSKYHLPTSKFTTYHPTENSNSICGNKIRSLYIDSNERLWIGTKHNGVCYFDLKSERFYQIKIDVEHVRSVVQTKDGLIWLGSFDEGIYSFSVNVDGNISDVKQFDCKVSNKDLNLNTNVYFVYEDHKFDVFGGTKDGLFKYDKLKEKFEQVKQNGTPDFFRCITRGPDGMYWVGTLNGVIRCRLLEDLSVNSYERQVSDPSVRYSLTNNYILSLYFDREKVLWLGTENGLEKYDPFKNQFKERRVESSPKRGVPIISSIASTFDGNLLLGTRAHGLSIVKSGNNEINIDGDHRISGLFTEDGKVFYCGLWDGRLLKYDYRTSRSQIFDIGFQDVPLFSFLKISDNVLLVGSNGDGIVAFNMTSHTSEKVYEKMFAGQDINKMVLTDSGFIWVATEHGVVKFDPFLGSIKKYNYSENDTIGLSNGKIKDIIIDAKGKVWAATRHGLNYYDSLSDNFRVASNPSQLKEAWVTDMAIDSKGQMWLNMNYNRVARYNPENSNLSVFTVNNGFRSNIFNKRGFLYTNGKIYLGGENSLIEFMPAIIIENNFSSEPIISDFKVQNKDVVPEVIMNGQVILNEDLNYSKFVSLNYQNRNFSLTVSVPSFVDEIQNRIQYKLEGFDNDWINVTGGSGNVQYTNLYSDKYIFKIRVGIANGDWSEPVDYIIKIEPPVWLSYQALFLYVIAIVLIAYLTRRQVKIRVNMKQELLLEKVKREHDEKLNNEKLRFFTNISHELRTPISLILGPTKQLIEEGGGTDYQKSRMNLIIQNSSRLLYLVNQLLDFRKAQNGELQLKVSKTDILLYTKNTFQSFETYAKDKKINFNLICEEDSIYGWIDRDKYDKILYNLLSNAIKFTPKYGNVDLFVGIKELKPKRVVIEVSDDGIGIPVESQKNIFSRFYQAENSMDANTGSGIGLSLVKSLVKLHRSTIEVDSLPDKGSIFALEIPIERNYYNDSEVFDYETKSSEPVTSNFAEAKKAVQSTHLKEKILIIEDNPELRKFAVEYLSDYFKVYEAESGIEGLKICRHVKPILCVSDVMMPLMDGFQFCKELKSDETISHIPVILLTALSDNENKIKGYKLGADAYLVKPFDPSLLKTRIDNIVKARVELKGKFSDEAESDVNTLTHSPVDEEFMTNLTAFIEENLSESELTASLLCEKMSMSSSKLYRKIKELTDLAPNEFIRTIRLKKSVQLLKGKRYNVSEVAILVGFNDPLYFSRCFKKQFGYPPSKALK